MSKDTFHDASETRDLRDAFGRFATGVAVVTARDDEGPVGLTISSFAAVSLAPPLLLFSVARSCRSLDRMTATPTYAVNVLARDQEALSNRFSGRGSEKWIETRHLDGPHGAPLLEGTLAVFECRHFARHEAGDHVVFIGEVLRFETAAEGQPLLYYRGGYGSLER